MNKENEKINNHRNLLRYIIIIIPIIIIISFLIIYPKIWHSKLKSSIANLDYSSFSHCSTKINDNNFICNELITNLKELEEKIKNNPNEDEFNQINNFYTLIISTENNNLSKENLETIEKQKKYVDYFFYIKKADEIVQSKNINYATVISNYYTAVNIFKDDDENKDLYKDAKKKYASIIEKANTELLNKVKKYISSKDYKGGYDFLIAHEEEIKDVCNAVLFEKYAKDFYSGNRKYYLQNYSNIDNKYIYELHILDDLEVTGGTEENEEKVEKLTVIREKSDYKIANQGYIGNKKYNNIIAQTEEMVVTVISKDISYKKEAYNLKVTNKTDKYILIADGTYSDEVTLNITDQKRKATNTQNSTFLIAPNSTISMMFIFDKFADDGKEPTEINFNDVRIYDQYNTKLKPEDAENLFSFNIKLKN